MRFFCYNEPTFDESGQFLRNDVIVVSEEEIRKEYYPYWKAQVEKKYGVEEAKRRFCFDDCLDDWIAVNMAWESRDE